MVCGSPKILSGSRVFVRSGKIDRKSLIRHVSAGPNEGGENMKNSRLAIVSAILLGTCQFTAAAAKKNKVQA
jgi:hypothetical protein